MQTKFTLSRRELDRLVFAAAVAACDYPAATWHDAAQRVVDKYAELLRPMKEKCQLTRLPNEADAKRIAELQESLRRFQVWYYLAQGALCSCHLPDNVVCQWHQENPGAPDAEVFSILNQLERQARAEMREQCIQTILECRTTGQAIDTIRALPDEPPAVRGL